MGRNAKFYKKTKPRSRPSAKSELYDADSGDDGRVSPVSSKSGHVRGTNRDVRQASKKQALKQRQQLQRDRNVDSITSSEQQRIDEKANELRPVSRSDTTSKSATKLKSKLWKGLEADRAAKGQREIATPREAGIDYLSQWERRHGSAGRSKHAK